MGLLVEPLTIVRAAVFIILLVASAIGLRLAVAAYAPWLEDLMRLMDNTCTCLTTPF